MPVPASAQVHPGTVFGARGATTALSRATAILAAIFMLNSLLLAYLATRPSAEAQRTLLDEAAQKPASLPGTGSNVPPAPAAPTSTPVPVPQAPAPAPAPTPRRSNCLAARTDSRHRRRGGIGRHTSLRG